MNATENTLTVANTIADQIGRQAFVMMGTKNLVGSADALLFDIRGCADFNKIEVKLSPMDTYTVRFMKLGRGSILRDVAVEGVYADSLKNVIESKTGLYLSL
jgi:hypothetical protein